MAVPRGIIDGEDSWQNVQPTNQWTLELRSQQNCDILALTHGLAVIWLHSEFLRVHAFPLWLLLDCFNLTLDLTPYLSVTIHMIIVGLYTGDYEDQPDDGGVGPFTHNATVFAFAATYGIPSLQQLAREKYEHLVDNLEAEQWHEVVDFVDSAREFFHLSGSIGEDMQDYWVATYAESGLDDLLEEEGFEEARESMRKLEEDFPALLEKLAEWADEA